MNDGYCTDTGNSDLMEMEFNLFKTLTIDQLNELNLHKYTAEIRK